MEHLLTGGDGLEPDEFLLERLSNACPYGLSARWAAQTSMIKKYGVIADFLLNLCARRLRIAADVAIEATDRSHIGRDGILNSAPPSGGGGLRVNF